MIQARGLTKTYGSSRGVSDVTFSVGKGEIVGFLGPNGAGKTTTMRLLTGYLYPNDGDAVIEDISILERPKDARKLIGYLPENNPLYEDLTVGEYLDFRARVKGLRGREIKKRIEDVAERCSIADVRKKLIGSCSKGYRQRIGIADALINDPPLLILDEPTQGLDPAQIHHTRELIKSLIAEHTIILSTHILSEMEAICTRALLIHKGRLQFDGTLDSMRAELACQGRVKVTLLCDAEKGAGLLSKIASVEKFEAEPAPPRGAAFSLTPKDSGDIREEIFWKCFDERVPILEMGLEKQSLEEAFLMLTREQALEENS
ncbi:MAG TPA: ATP-binding cassette domain-containing protein [Acidobacteriota bacterium]|nr:ATP-binding cassette domain-containing protein [Acidobacteriota bacterium]HNT17852.1 ATP-binding cassette domain-containing protein [Acidobacteriota bacterium]HPA26747.1 ATP-binding cassette domain-containing protein [Acidobacteriota bacterium]HQO20472.1 ATP-binding cassette domain-containing protein [Acidobacteriota bacterium]